MQTDTVQIIDQLIEGAIRDHQLEQQFSQILRDMSLADRAELPDILVNRAKVIANRMNFDIRHKLNADHYIQNRLDEVDGVDDMDIWDDLSDLECAFDETMFDNDD
jgi:hypothetical protein